MGLISRWVIIGRTMLIALLFMIGTSFGLISRQGDGSMLLLTASPNGGIIISANGNVGIGTTATSTKLDVAGTISASALVVNGAISVGAGVKTTSSTLTQSDSIVLVNNPANVNITLPLAGGSGGRYYTIKKTNDNDYTVSVILSGSDTLDGSASAFVLTTPWQYVIVASDGAGWYVVGGN